MAWDAAWTEERHRRHERQRQASRAGAPPPAWSLVRIPDGLDDNAADTYRRKYRSLMAVVPSREIAVRYPFAGAIAHLKSRNCPLGLLFSGRAAHDDGALFRAAERYVAHSISHGTKGAWGGGNGGAPSSPSSPHAAGISSGGGSGRMRPTPHADADQVEIDGSQYCGEAVTYALALMIAHVCGPRVAAKFAMGHAQWTIGNMRADMRGSQTAATSRFVQDYIWFLMPYLEAEDGGGSSGAGGMFHIGVADYLRRSVHIADPAWKIVNRRVHGGGVVVKLGELLRLARHDIFSLIERDVAATRVDKAAGKALEIHVRNIARDARYNDEAVREATATAGTAGRPPCVTEAIASLARAENLPHHGRLLVASYMLRTGMSRDDVSALFRNAPDYSEEVTRKQVGHVANGQYMPHSCEKLESLGLCRRVPACGAIRNPVQFRMPQKKAGSAGSEK